MANYDIQCMKEMDIADIKDVSWMRYYKYMLNIEQEHQCTCIMILHVGPY